MPSIVKAIQLALQLDLFSDFLLPERRKAKPEAPELPSPTPKLIAPPTSKNDDQHSSRPSLPLAPPQDKTDAGNHRRILMNGTILEYDLQRSKRRSIGFLINDEGLRITAPRWVTISAIESAIHEKQNWILRKLSERHERTLGKREPVMVWGDGAKLAYLGNEIVVRVLNVLNTGAHFDSETNELHVRLPVDASEQQLKDLIRNWLQQQAKREFNERLPRYAEKLNVHYHSVSLSAATTRWGSCTSQGKIRLNWRLIHFSPLIIDYVIAHELAHLKEMNHSPRFWATVESIFPDFDIARRQLRQHATTDLPNF
ncbi:M48 family metallopeptidase [Undibacterium sp. SXout11W]|uniref:M48 family metallopeptidase n=1 Tax=Undibacterium sp. SXout11W TaxID=3413050 RepID=UPI003BF3FCE5